MAFRTQTGIGAALFLSLALARAESIQVRHTHLRHGGAGRLEVTASGISFTEEGKHREHSRSWKYEDIQELRLTTETLTVLTYEDQKWKLGRDREYLFDQLPDGFAARIFPEWRARLDQRFVAALPGMAPQVLWEIPAKLFGTIRGAQGRLKVTADGIEFETPEKGASRAWRDADIQSLASAGPFDLSIVTREHHGAVNGSGREFRFQLKQTLEERRYNQLWRRLNHSGEPRLATAYSDPH